MARSHLMPLEVDEVRVTTVVDNSIDILMASGEVAHRYLLGPKWLPLMSSVASPFEGKMPVAEHGYSALIQTRMAEKHTRSCSTRALVELAS